MATYRRQQSGSLGTETACPTCSPTVYTYKMEICSTGATAYVDRTSAFNNTTNVTIQPGSTFHNLSLNQVVYIKTTSTGPTVCAKNLGTSTTTATFKINIAAGPFNACNQCFSP